MSDLDRILQVAEHVLKHHQSASLYALVSSLRNMGYTDAEIQEGLRIALGRI